MSAPHDPATTQHPVVIANDAVDASINPTINGAPAIKVVPTWFLVNPANMTINVRNEGTTDTISPTCGNE